jgi:hypothetical protein
MHVISNANHFSLIKSQKLTLRMFGLKSSRKQNAVLEHLRSETVV